jgi:Flp pilus assembly protein TadD
MAKEGLFIPRHFTLKRALFVLVLLACSCSMPRIITFEDPLSAKEHNDLGVAYEQKGMFDLAEKEYKKAAEKQKDWAIPYFNLGNLSYRKGALKSSEDYYRTALTYESNNPDILNNLANLLFEEGRREEARDLIERALLIQRKKEYLDTYHKILGKEKQDSR